jgi:hypothetical protein
MRARAALLPLALAGCAGQEGDFNGRVEGAFEGVLSGESWYCEGPSGAALVMVDRRSGSTITFDADPGGVKPGAWLVRGQRQPGTFAVTTAFDTTFDPDAGRLAVHVRSGTLTIDAVQDGTASGRYRAETVTVDALPTVHKDGRVGRIPNMSGALVGFFKAVKRECPPNVPSPRPAAP